MCSSTVASLPKMYAHRRLQCSLTIHFFPILNHSVDDSAYGSEIQLYPSNMNAPSLHQNVKALRSIVRSAFKYNVISPPMVRLWNVLQPTMCRVASVLWIACKPKNSGQSSTWCVLWRCSVVRARAGASSRYCCFACCCYSSSLLWGNKANTQVGSFAPPVCCRFTQMNMHRTEKSASF